MTRTPDEIQDEEVWTCPVCGNEFHVDQVGKFCPCGDVDMDAFEADLREGQIK